MAFAWAADGTRLHYQVLGRPGADPVLMIQGLGTDMSGWMLQRLAFSPRYRTIALDNRGAGRSDKPFGRYRLEEMADDAVAVLDAAGVERAHVMGASMGGAIAQLVALRHPERVQSMVLACTACSNHLWRRELLSEWAAIANERGMGEMAKRAAHWVMAPRSVRRFWPAVGWFGPLAMGLPAHAFASQVRAILDAPEQMADVLATVAVPTLVVVGNQDILTPRGDSEELAERIPGAELVVISGAAHGLMIEHATTFNKVVMDFLGRVASEQDSGVMRVAIVGAGLAGLMAGRTLAEAGHEVILLDKGRSPGGRLATRRIGEATLDHGAQFFTVRSEAFAARVDRWEADGLVHVWCRGFEVEDGHPRYAVRGGMNALAKHLATGLDVRYSTLAFALRPGPDRPGGPGSDRRAWSVGLDDGTEVDADAVVLTCPLPQSFSLMITAAVELPAPLRRTDYDRTLALLTVLDGDPAVPAPGGVQQPGDPFGFLGDNRAKGVSAVPAVTFHATPAWSLEWWDRPAPEAQAALLEAAAPWLGRATVVAAQLKRWRFATPQAVWPEPCWAAADGPGPLVLAGDAFAGPRVEGAALSGLAAAYALLSR